MLIHSKISPEQQKMDAAYLRSEAGRIFRQALSVTGPMADRAFEKAERYIAQADRLERAYLSEGECLDDGRGPLTPEERTALDAVPVGTLP